MRCSSDRFAVPGCRQARFPDQSTLLQLPHATDPVVHALEQAVFASGGPRASCAMLGDHGDSVPVPASVPVSLPEVMALSASQLQQRLRRVSGLSSARADGVAAAISQLPAIDVTTDFVGGTAAVPAGRSRARHACLRLRRLQGLCV